MSYRIIQNKWWKTDKQKEKARQGLEKAMSSLETALKKVADAQVQYNVLIVNIVGSP